jgi:molybdopterin/thiamine biosynthesis adenylyltransferase
MLSDEALARYSRQILVPGLDIEGQARLAASQVVIVGCGGLGCPLALYLAAAGVGRLRLVDDDHIELSNLPRQVAFTEADVGLQKAEVLAARARAMNTDIRVESVSVKAVSDNALALFKGATLVIDATDSHAARCVIEDATRVHAIPWIMGAAIQMSGQWMAFGPQRAEGCYHCLAPQAAEAEAGGCARLGVMGPVVGAVAMMQANTALMLLAGESVAWGRLSIYDFRRSEQQSLALKPRAGCAACSAS